MIVQVRLRNELDRREWLDIPVSFTFNSDSSPVEDQLNDLRNSLITTSVKEIRWNWIESYQGHYMTVPQPTAIMKGLN